MRLKLLGLFLALILIHTAEAAGPACPAGMPLGALQLTVTRRQGSTPLPLNRVNRLEEGDRISYTPVLKPSEKRTGEVAIVLIAASPTAGDQQDFSVLEPKNASKPAQWTVPWRSALALYVYGPSGLSARKLRGFIARDQELVAQLADYAEKTAQTESVLAALANYQLTGRNDGVSAALEGFAGQYGNSNKIDRSAPSDQQTLSALRTLNPALSAYDPISPSASHRVAQTTGLATTVAGMFLGSTVGLTAGGAAMALNLKTLMFPDTEFRSAYSNESNLCSTREPNPSRKRRAYLWAMRVPNAGPPAIALPEVAHLPEGQPSAVRVKVADPDWKLVSRAREWTLQPANGKPVPVAVTPVNDGRALELNLSKTQIPPGNYTLAALWDWDPFILRGPLTIAPLGTLAGARLTPDTANRLLEHSGKQIVNLEGTANDFQFVEKITIIRQGDKYATPTTVPFSLPRGPRNGPQDRLEMQVDTGSMSSGTWLLALTQSGGATQTIPVQIVKAPPAIENLPIAVNCGMNGDTVTLRGEGLDRITALEAEGVRFAIDDASPKSLTIRITADSKWSPGTRADLRLSIRDYAAPLLLPGAVLLAGARPQIREVEPSIPTGLPIALRKGELLAGVTTNLLLRVDGASPTSALAIRCRNSAESTTVRPGPGDDRLRVQPPSNGSMFLSLDAGRWPSGCVLTATLDTPENGRSKPVELGTVVRMPAIEAFRLTAEPAGDNMFTGVLTGRDLELIEKTGWDATNGQPVTEIPAAIVGQGNRQSLKIRMPWPSPTPHAPLYLWLRGETEGRETTVRY